MSLPTAPSEVLIWKALPVAVWTAHIVPGANRRGILCLAQVSSTRLVAPVLRLFWLLGMHKPTWQHHPCPLSYHLCSDITDWAKMLSPCRFINVAGMAQGIATQCLLNKAILFHHRITLVPTLFFMAKTFCLCR